MEATLEQRGGEEEGLEPTQEHRVRWEEGGLDSNLESERQGSSWVLSLSSLPCHSHCTQVLFKTTFHGHLHKTQVGLQSPTSRPKSSTAPSKSCLLPSSSGTTSKQPIPHIPLKKYQYNFCL